MLTEKTRYTPGITETELYKNRTKKALFNMICIASMMGLSLISMHMFHRGHLDKEGYATLTKILLVSLFWGGHYFLPYPLSCYGLNTNNMQKVLKESISIAFILLGLCVGYRYLLATHGVKEMQFRLHLRLDILFYPVFAFLQEIITKGFVQSYLVAALDGFKHRRLYAIIVSSIVFALTHLIHGYSVFAGLFVFSLLTGWFYERSRNIWGVTIIHTILGWSLFYFQ
ncbi:MAG: CPBP family intramembrane metalloprotease [Spirochaetales bacterium]|nr:CPBP family intramembrane metalloprotease [Spirochaetales bacterium]